MQGEARPVGQWEDQDTAWHKVSEEIKAVAGELTERSPQERSSDR